MVNEKGIYISDPYRDGTMVKLTGTKNQLLRLGLTSDDLEGPNETTGNYFVRQPVDSPLIVRARVQNAADAKADMKRVRQMSMRVFVENPEAELFYTTIARSKIGDKVRTRTFGVKALGLRWDELASVMLRNGWVEDADMRLTKVGIDEALSCVRAMHAGWTASNIAGLGNGEDE